MIAHAMAHVKRARAIMHNATSTSYGAKRKHNDDQPIQNKHVKQEATHTYFDDNGNPIERPIETEHVKQEASHIRSDDGGNPIERPFGTKHAKQASHIRFDDDESMEIEPSKHIHTLRNGSDCNHFRKFLNIQKDFSDNAANIGGRYNNACCKCHWCTDSTNLHIFKSESKWVIPDTQNAIFENGASLFPSLKNDKENDIRVVVFSDIHRDVIGFLAALVHAQVINCGLKCICKNVVIVCCGDMLDGHRSDDALQEGNCREEIDLFQIFEYLRSIGIVVLLVAGNHEVMRKDGLDHYRGNHEAKWFKKDQDDGYLGPYIAAVCPLVMNIGKLVFSHSIPDSTEGFPSVGKGKHAGLNVLNEMLYEHMHAAPNPEFHTGTHFIKRMLWDRSVVNTGECSVLPDFFKCLGVPEDCIAFVGHTKATCKNKPKVFCKQEEKSGHVRLCKEKLHAMDTHWSLAFKKGKKLSANSTYKQRIAYAVVTNVFSSPQVQSCVCDLQWSPQKHMALI